MNEWHGVSMWFDMKSQNVTRFKVGNQCPCKYYEYISVIKKNSRKILLNRLDYWHQPTNWRYESMFKCELVWIGLNQSSFWIIWAGYYYCCCCCLFFCFLILWIYLCCVSCVLHYWRVSAPFYWHAIMKIQLCLVSLTVFLLLFYSLSYFSKHTHKWFGSFCCSLIHRNQHSQINKKKPIRAGDANAYIEYTQRIVFFFSLQLFWFRSCELFPNRLDCNVHNIFNRLLYIHRK